MMGKTITVEFLRRSLDRIVSMAQAFGDVEHDGVMGVLREEKKRGRIYYLSP